MLVMVADQNIIIGLAFVNNQNVLLVVGSLRRERCHEGGEGVFPFYWEMVMNGVTFCGWITCPTVIIKSGIMFSTGRRERPSTKRRWCFYYGSGRGTREGGLDGLKRRSG